MPLTRETTAHVEVLITLPSGRLVVPYSDAAALAACNLALKVWTAEDPARTWRGLQGTLRLHVG